MTLVNWCPCFYGWVILLVATLGKALTGPGQSPVIGNFITSLREEFNLTRTLISTMYLIATTISGLSLPFMGHYVDKIGVRKMTCIVGACLGLACIFISTIRSKWLLPVGFFFLRYFGQGSLMLCCKTSINLWWVRRRGIIMGIGGVGASLGITGIIPPLTKFLISKFGWRFTYRIFAQILGVYACIAGFFLRDSPEKMGMLPDGDCSPESNGEDGEDLKVDEFNWTRDQAIRTATFWLLNFCFFMFAAIGTAWWFFLPDIIEQYKISDQIVNILYPSVAVAGICGRLISGVFLGPLSEKQIMTMALTCLSMSCLVSSFVNENRQIFLVIAGVILAAGNNMMFNIAAVVWANFYGRAHVGSITSISDTCVVVGSAIGPLPFGYVRDRFGDFRPILLLCVILPIPCAIIILSCVRRPKDDSYSQLELQKFEQPCSPQEAEEQVA